MLWLFKLIKLRFLHHKVPISDFDSIHHFHLKPISNFAYVTMPTITIYTYASAKYIWHTHNNKLCFNLLLIISNTAKIYRINSQQRKFLPALIFWQFLNFKLTFLLLGHLSIKFSNILKLYLFIINSFTHRNIMFYNFLI